jgi:hypothetical protein
VKRKCLSLINTYSSKYEGKVKGLIHYRTENMCALGGSLQWLTDRLVRQQRRDQEPVGDRYVVLEAARQQAQPQAKEAQVAPIPSMQLLEPAVTQGTHAEIDQPQIGQARGDQQAREPLRITEVTPM